MGTGGDSRGAEEGFTLIELMVVLLIIAILLAIAIPTFLGVTASANDRATQANLTSAAEELRVFYDNSGQSFSSVDTPLVTTAAATASLTTAIPAYGWTQGTFAGSGVCNSGARSNCLSFATLDVGSVRDDQGIALAAYSKGTDTCWYALVLEVTPGPIIGNIFESESPFAFYRYVSPGSDPQLGPFGSSTAITTAGTYYAYKTKIGSSGDCSTVFSAVQVLYWGRTFAEAPSSN